MQSLGSRNHNKRSQSWGYVEWKRRWNFVFAEKHRQRWTVGRWRVRLQYPRPLQIHCPDSAQTMPRQRPEAHRFISQFSPFETTNLFSLSLSLSLTTLFCRSKTIETRWYGGWLSPIPRTRKFVPQHTRKSPWFIPPLISYSRRDFNHCLLFLLPLPGEMGLRESHPGGDYRSDRRRHHLRGAAGQHPRTQLARDLPRSGICRSDSHYL